MCVRVLYVRVRMCAYMPFISILRVFNILDDTFTYLYKKNGLNRFFSMRVCVRAYTESDAMYYVFKCKIVYACVRTCM